MTEPLPVSDDAFWKARIISALDRKHFHYSVYDAPDALWDEIKSIHRPIIERETRDLNTLDAGCGYGRAMRWVTGPYTGVDNSPSLLGYARRAYPAAFFVDGDLRALPFEDGEFDIAFCISMRRMVCENLGTAEWERMAKELKRVARRVFLLEYENPNKIVWL